MSTKLTRADNKRFTRIIPAAAIMYMMALIDRNNIGYAFEGMNNSFHLSASVMGLVGGIFFIGYLLLQIPGGHFAAKYSAKKIIFFSIICWGLVAISLGLIQNSTQLLICRFLLGITESMVYPTTLILISKWFPLSERARAIGYWSIGGTLAGLIVGPLSGFIVDNLSWRWLFILEGLPALLMAFVWWWAIAETPQEAKFLSKNEKDYLAKEFAKDALVNNGVVNGGWKAALSNKFVWYLTLVFLLNNTFNYGLGLWLPNVVKNLTGSSYTIIGLLTSVAAGLGILSMYITANHSDKTKERKWHAAIILMVSGLSLLVSILSIGTPFVSIAFILLAQGIWGGFSSVFWSIPPLLVSATALGAATGLINGVGNLGGFLGPYVFGFLIDKTGSTSTGLLFIVFVQILAGVLLACLRHKNLKNNKTTKENNKPWKETKLS
ncbi:MFS transporter [Peribacillus frigoritolerans]